MKICTQCLQEKDGRHFRRYGPVCLDCSPAPTRTELTKAWRQRKRMRKELERLENENTEYCVDCKEQKSVYEFYKIELDKKYAKRCKPCMKAKQNRMKLQNQRNVDRALRIRQLQLELRQSKGEDVRQQLDIVHQLLNRKHDIADPVSLMELVEYDAMDEKMRKEARDTMPDAQRDTGKKPGWTEAQDKELKAQLALMGIEMDW